MENSRPHWTARPWPMLAAATGTALAANLITSGYMIAVNLLRDSGQQASSGAPSILSLSVFITPAISVLFYCLISRAQRRQGSPEGASWKLGWAFWVGLPLYLLYLALLCGGDILTYPRLTAGLALSVLSSGFSLSLYFCLLFPLMERRFGMITGAVVLSLAFAMLSVVQIAAIRIASVPPTRFAIIKPLSIWSGLALSMCTAFLSTAPVYTLRSALYLSASRRAPGTWMLFACVPGLLTLPLSKIETGLNPVVLSRWMQLLCIELPYYLLIFALSLGVLAGFQRWKTFGEFASALRELMKKAKRTQNDIGN